jgi:hypothetical protein
VEVLTLVLAEVLILVLAVEHIPAQVEVLILVLVEGHILDLVVVATTAQVEVELISGTGLILIVSKQNLKNFTLLRLLSQLYDE